MDSVRSKLPTNRYVAGDAVASTTMPLNPSVGNEMTASASQSEFADTGSTLETGNAIIVTVSTGSRVAIEFILKSRSQIWYKAMIDRVGKTCSRSPTMGIVRLEPHRIARNVRRIVILP